MLRTLGWPELLVIAVLIVFLFGGRRLGQAGRWAGNRTRRPFHVVKLAWTWLGGTNAEGCRQERVIGADLAREYAEQHPGDISPTARALVKSLGEKLSSREKGLQFSFDVVHDPGPTALALPGGFVFVSDSLVALLGMDEDELAFVLGHEIAHVLEGHARERFMSETILNAVSSRSAGISRILRHLVQQTYSQEQELDADRIGADLAARCGYDRAGAARALRRLQNIEVGEPELLAYFSSHPPMQTRVAALDGSGGAAGVS